MLGRPIFAWHDETRNLRPLLPRSRTVTHMGESPLPMPSATSPTLREAPGARTTLRFCPFRWAPLFMQWQPKFPPQVASSVHGPMSRTLLGAGDDMPILLPRLMQSYRAPLLN